MISLLLNMLSILGVLLLIVAANIYGTIRIITKLSRKYKLTEAYKEWSKWQYDQATSHDQAIGVSCKYFLNDTWIYPDGIPYGNPDETISSNTGKNKRIGRLRPHGKWWDRLLDKLDPNHTIKSIEENP